jgi:hypothetical protein
MRAFRRSRHRFVAVFEPQEASALSVLAAEVADLLQARSAREADPAVLRMLPDAYPDDAEASAEFRRFTADGLAERKVANARRVIADLAAAAAAASPTAVKVDGQAAQAWVRSLTDIRLTIASRLGIDTGGGSDTGGSSDPAGPDPVPVDPVLVDLYDWLGFVQGSLVDCLDD